MAACFAPEVMSEGKSMSPLSLAFKVGKVSASQHDSTDSSQAGARSPRWVVLESDGPYARGQSTDTAEACAHWGLGAGL